MGKNEFYAGDCLILIPESPVREEAGGPVILSADLAEGLLTNRNIRNGENQRYTILIL